jgi:alpha-galactosidase
MRRAVPLWRSDYAYEAIGHQCMTYGLSLWLPFHGTGTVFARNASYYGSGRTPVEPYAFWSNAGQLSLGLGIDLRERELDYAAMRRLLAQWREVSPNHYGDFHPLTPWTRDDKVWMAWRFDRPEAGQGVVLVFRRHHSFYEAALQTARPGSRGALSRHQLRPRRRERDDRPGTAGARPFRCPRRSSFDGGRCVPAREVTASGLLTRCKICGPAAARSA